MNERKSSVFSPDFIRFLGTAGARVVLSKQLRSSGGIWVRMSGQNLLIDPGPGTLVRCWEGEDPLDPSQLDAIVLTHRHLDHSGDMNVMVEAMAQGGFHPHGLVFGPQDALEGPEPILFSYLREYLDGVYFLIEGANYSIGRIGLEAPVRHDHPVETYGIKIRSAKKSISYITDTRFFPKLIDVYRADIVIISMTFIKPFHGPNAFHLSKEEIVPLIAGLKPEKVLLTHFGRNVIQAGPDKAARELEEETGIPVVAAEDGMIVFF